MKYCSKCGKEIEDEAVVCVHCGCSVENRTVTKEIDGPNIAFTILGFFIPLVGLILYLVYKDTMPEKAKSAGKGALIGVCVSVGLSILSSILGGIWLSSIFSSF